MSLFKVFKKSEKEFPKSLTIYISSELGKILIASHYIDESWLRYEQEEIEILNLDCDDEILGASIKRSFNLFTKKNLANKKRTLKDWSSYKASKLKSVKEFEEKYFKISINGANEANLLMVCEADMKSADNINLTSSISAFADNQKIGYLIKKLNTLQNKLDLE